MDYQLIYVPLIAAIIAQIIKLIIDAKRGKFSWSDLNSYGGMPSSHAALVVSLAAMIGYSIGWSSAPFAIALVLALLTIRDAGGFRRVLGVHAEELNQLTQNLTHIQPTDYPYLKERIGHTPLQLFVGSLVGLMVTCLYLIIF